MSDNPHAGERVRLRWGWILVCTLLGLALLALAAYGETKKWDDVATGTLVNIGSALLFSFVLFFFENRFTKRVVSTVQRVTDEAEQRITKQTAEVTTKLDDLEARLAAGDTARRAAATSAVDPLETEANARLVEQALRASSSEGVIDKRRGVTVPGYEGATDLTVTFAEIPQASSGGVDSGAPSTPRELPDGVVVSLGVDHRTSERGTPRVDLVWAPAMDAAQLAEAFGVELRRWDRHDEARKIDWTHVFRMLARALRLANTVTQPDAALGGRLYELVNDNWVVTSAGIEQLDPHRRIPFDDAFPVTPAMRPRPFESGIPAAPAGIDDATWTHLRKRAAFYKPAY